MVDATTGEIVGLVGQKLCYGSLEPEEDIFYRRTQRCRVIDLTGAPAGIVPYIHGFDREGKTRTCSALCSCNHLLMQQCDWVIRTAQLQRTISIRMRSFPSFHVERGVRPGALPLTLSDALHIDAVLRPGLA